MAAIRKSIWALIFVVMSGVSSVYAGVPQTDLLYDTYPVNPVLFYSVNRNSEPMMEFWDGSRVASPFSYAVGDYILTNATLSIRMARGTIDDLTVGVYSDSAGTPGAFLFQLDNPESITPTFEDHAFTSSSPMVLSAGTTYWLIMDPSLSTECSFGWLASSTFLNNLKYSDLDWISGTSWGAWKSGNDTVAMKIYGTPPPPLLPGAIDRPTSEYGALVSVGYEHAAGLKSDGKIVAWGKDNNGQATGSGEDADFVAVSAGHSYTLGLKSDGTVVNWGRSPYTGSAMLPVSNADFVAISAGSGHALGIKSDGSILTWGYSGYNLLTIPEPNANFVAVSAGDMYSLGLKSDGTIVAWGRTTSGQADVPAPNANFVAISAGNYHALGLKSDGTIVGWGSDAYGATTVPGENANFVAVAAGMRYSLGLKADGTIVAWGNSSSPAMTVPEPNADFIAISASHSLAIGLKSDGSIVVWGWNDNEETTVPEPNLDFGREVSGIAPQRVSWMGGEQVTITGQNLCDGTDVTSVTLCGVEVASIDSVSSTQIVVTAAAGTAGTGNLVVTSTSHGTTTKFFGFTYIKADQVITFLPIGGQIVNHPVGLSATASSGLPVSFSVLNGLASIANGTNVTFFGVGSVSIVASQAGNASWKVAPNVTNTFYVYALSADAGPAAGGNSITITAANSALDITSVIVGGVAATITGQTANSVTITLPTGAAGAVDIVIQSTSTGTTTLPNAYTYNPAGRIGGDARGAITSKGWHSLALKPDGSLMGWGNDQDNQVRDIPSGSNFIAIASGAWYSLALKSDGSLVGWGWDFDGQNTPSGSDFVAIAGGGTHALALKSDGSLVSWGRNANGVVANTPTGSDFVMIAGGLDHSLALKSDGVIVSWGNNGYGQVANTPSDTDFVAIAAGGYHSLALKADGSIVSWGNDAFGLMADIPSGNDFVAIAGGAYHSLALKLDGSIVSWGNDGNGLVTYTPLGTDFVAIASGVSHSLALKSDGSIVSWGDNEYDQVTDTPTGTVLGGPTGVQPASGSSTGGFPVTISGTNLGNGTDVTSVTLNGIEVTSIESQSSTQIVVMAGAAIRAGVGDVVVTSISYGTTTKADAFEYLRTEQAALTFAPTSPQAYASTNALFVSGGSGTGAVSYVVTSGPGEIVDGTNLVVTAGSGTIMIVATQAQDDLYFATSATGTVTAVKADQTITFPAISNQITTNTVALSATASSGLTVSFTVSAGPGSITGGILSFTGPGSVSVAAIQGGDANWNEAMNAITTFTVAKASATVTLADLSQTYTGVARSVTATTTPAGLTVDFTYDGSTTAPTAAGSYEVVGTINDANYEGSVNGTLKVNKATATVTLGGLSQTYDGTARIISATTTPAGLTVEFTYDGNAGAPTNAGTYTVTGTVNEDNWLGSSTSLLVVARGTDTITFGATNHVYDGTAKAVTVTSLNGQTVAVSYDGAATEPENAGTYTVMGIVDAANWTSTNTTTLVIEKADQTISNFLPADGTSFLRGTNTAISAEASSGLTVSFENLTPEIATLSGANITFFQAGEAQVSASQAGNANWNAASTITHTWPCMENTFRVTFDAQGGIEPNPATQNVTYNATYGTLPTTTRAGYTFAGWWTEADGNGTEITDETVVATASDHTLYAYWTGLLVSVHRFWAPASNAHFYTMNETEKNNIVANLSAYWTYEGIAFDAYSVQVSGTLPVYRFWSPVFGGHFYTMNETEKNNLIANLSRDWAYEGIAYYACSTAVSGSSPVYRFWSPRYKHHFYTISEAEKNNIIANLSRDWAYEGIAYYAFAPVRRNAFSEASVPETAGDLTGRTVRAAEPSYHDLNSSLDVSGTASIQSVTTPAFGDIVFPISYPGCNVAAYVYDSVVGAWQCVLPATNSPASLVLGNIQPDRSYTLEVFAGDPADGELVSVHRSSFEMQLDAPASIHEAVASQVVSDGVGSPVVRLAAPAVDGTLSIKLYSSSQGVVQTLTGVTSGETVDLAVPEWNTWYWVSGYQESDNGLVLSIWLRHDAE